jgi:hypothetical protein
MVTMSRLLDPFSMCLMLIMYCRGLDSTEVDWDQKASATTHTKKFKKPSNFLQKALRPMSRSCYYGQSALETVAMCNARRGVSPLILRNCASAYDLPLCLRDTFLGGDGQDMRKDRRTDQNPGVCRRLGSIYEPTDTQNG